MRMHKAKKERLDRQLVERGLADDSDKAQRQIRAGKVRVDGAVADKPGHLYAADAEISVAAAKRYVSRGGYKLETAFREFALDVAGCVCLDVGASTGGFTDCLLQHGAEMVYAVDCGRGQLDWSLRRDERVTVMENCNARYLDPRSFDPPPVFAVADASFISLAKLLPGINEVLDEAGRIVALIKPQFEARREQVEAGGVVRDEGVHREVIDSVRGFAEKNLGLIWRGIVESDIVGPAGNREFLAYWSKA